MKRKLYTAIVSTLLEHEDHAFLKRSLSEDTAYFIHKSYDAAKAGVKNEYIHMMFQTDFVLTGVGAPIHIFLGDVAKLLGAKAVIPPYHEVANALGAIVGNVCAFYTVEIQPHYTVRGITGFTVFGSGSANAFKNLEEASEFAIEEAKNGARAEAIRRGAGGEITLSYTLDKKEAEASNGATVYLGTQIIAQAVGNIGY